MPTPTPLPNQSGKTRRLKNSSDRTPPMTRPPPVNTILIDMFSVLFYFFFSMQFEASTKIHHYVICVRCFTCFDQCVGEASIKFLSKFVFTKTRLLYFRCHFNFSFTFESRQCDLDETISFDQTSNFYFYYFFFLEENTISFAISMPIETLCWSAVK